MKHLSKLNWRITWYSVLIWLLAFIVAGLVIIPWFYLALAAVIFLTTFYYFKKIDDRQSFGSHNQKLGRDKIFAFGLVASLFWFFILAFLNFLEIAGLYYFDFFLYFSDFRNWYLLALVLLIPVVYSLILENSTQSKNSRL